MATNPLRHMEISNHNRGQLSNTFGMVRDGGATPHQGWDLAAPVGAPVRAVKHGIVVLVKDDGNRGYGKQIAIQISRGASGEKMTSEDSDVYAFYAHLSSIAVTVGDLVKEGQMIGAVGQTGNAGGTPPHLHFEIRTRLVVGRGLPGRVDPGTVLGYEHLTSRQQFECPNWD